MPPVFHPLVRRAHPNEMAARISQVLDARVAIPTVR